MDRIVNPSKVEIKIEKFCAKDIPALMQLHYFIAGIQNITHKVHKLNRAFRCLVMVLIPVHKWFYVNFVN